MHVIVSQSPELNRALLGPEKQRWGLAEQLLAVNADALNWLVWSKTKDAEKGRNKPKPIPRPGVDTEADVRTIGTPAPIEEILKFV